MSLSFNTQFNKPQLKRDFKAFVAGSSILAVLVTFTYVGLAWKRTRTTNFPYEMFAIFLPVLFGLWNVFLLRFQTKNVWVYSSVMTVGGMLFGLMLSFVGSQIMHVPQKLQSFGWPDTLLPLKTAWILYGVVWGVIVNFINTGVGLSPVKF